MNSLTNDVEIVILTTYEDKSFEQKCLKFASDPIFFRLLALSKRTKSSETFLLSSAALANLTFMEPSVVALMRRHNTVKVLVAAIRLQRTVSIYIQDQVRAMTR